jgi:hypothetical protein
MFSDSWIKDLLNKHEALSPNPIATKKKKNHIYLEGPDICLYLSLNVEDYLPLQCTHTAQKVLRW